MSESRQQSQRTTRSMPSTSMDFQRVSLQIGQDMSGIRYQVSGIRCQDMSRGS